MMSTPTTPTRLLTAEWKPRDEQLLRKTLKMLCEFVWSGKPPTGEHVWSIPVDEERDFDCIISDAIGELVARRAEVCALSDLLAQREEEIRQLREGLENVARHPHCAYDHPANQVGSPDSNYHIGVADGHRCAASAAMVTLDAIEAKKKRRELVRPAPPTGQEDA